jgi:predicted MFS family arabinose efflux permease
MSTGANYRRYVTGLLLCIYVFNQLDRAVFAILMEPIRHDLSFSDSQLGFLGGPALVIVYGLLGIPVARWADRSHRINLMTGAVALWSIIVMATAGAVSFAQFALSRIGVGIGEAGFSAVAQSVISDYNPPAVRARALSVFMLAIPLGGALSGLLGGWLNEGFGWRIAFIAAGLPGLLLALVLKLTVAEPSRAPRREAPDDRASSLLEIFRIIWRRRALRHLTIAMALANLLAGVFYWNATFFVRTHGMSTGAVGTWIAFNSGVGGVLGTWAGGWLPQRLAASRAGSQTKILSGSTLLCCMALIATWSWPGAGVAMGFAFLANVCLAFFYAPAFALVHSLTTPHARTTVIATVILLQMLCSGIVGLQATGLLSDAFAAIFGGDRLEWAMIAMTPFGLWAAAHFWLASRTLSDDVREAAHAT